MLREGEGLHKEQVTARHARAHMGRTYMHLRKAEGSTRYGEASTTILQFTAAPASAVTRLLVPPG